MSEIFDVAKGLVRKKGEEVLGMDYTTRDYLQEAKDIIAGNSMLLCERKHLIALNEVIRDMLPLLTDLEKMANSLKGGD